MEDPEMNSHTYGHLIFDKVKHLIEKQQLPQQTVLAHLALSMQKNENRPFLISLYKAQVQVDQRSPH